MIDLDKIRALLASVAGFTEGPWGWSTDRELCLVPGLVTPRGLYIMTGWTAAAPVEVKPCTPADGRILAAAPDLHRELTDAVGEIEDLRAQVERHIEGRIIAESAARTGLDEIERLRTQVVDLATARDTVAMMIPVGEDAAGSVEENLTLHLSHLRTRVSDRDAEIERLRAHNARMSDLLNKVANAMDAADREPTWSDSMIVVTDSLPDAPDLRRLAAGEVDDG